MSTPRARPRMAQGVAGALEVRRKGEEQVRRLLTDTPTPEPPASGGIVDIAKVSSVNTFPSFAGVPWPSGSSDVDHFGTVYGPIESTMTGDPVDWLTVDLGGISPTEEGFYEARCYVYLQWASMAVSCGVWVQVYLNGRDIPDAPTRTVYETDAGAALFVDNFCDGPQWMTPSDAWRLEIDGQHATSADVAVSSAQWRITKYGAA